MRLEIERSDESKRDLIEIWHFIASRNVSAADGVLRRILEVLNLLGEHPELGSVLNRVAEVTGG